MTVAYYCGLLQYIRTVFFCVLQGKARLAQPDFHAGEGIYLMHNFVESRESNQNLVWVGAVRPHDRSRRWQYLERPSPPDFHDRDVWPWGRRQPDDHTNDHVFQSHLMVGRLWTWKSKGYGDTA